MGRKVARCCGVQQLYVKREMKVIRERKGCEGEGSDSLWPDNLVSQGPSPFSPKNAMKNCAIILFAMPTLTACSSCPDLSSMRSDFIRTSFDSAKLAGLFTEQVYFDIAQGKMDEGRSIALSLGVRCT
jgi:hypothetical protein